jgi:ribonuclease-3
MDLGRWLSVGKGEERSGGRTKEKILAAAYEAVLGAVYLDAGWEPARQVVEAHFAPHMTREPEAPGHRDYKTRLQELTQRVHREMPAYTLVEERGPDHEKEFIVELAVGGRVLGRGVGAARSSRSRRRRWKRSPRSSGPATRADAPSDSPSWRERLVALDPPPTDR